MQIEIKKPELQVLYNICCARVSDSCQKFIEAARSYYELSHCPIVNTDEQISVLQNALICTILSLADESRSQMLATLFEDERCQQLPAYSILEKIHLDRNIQRSELQEIETMLRVHQKVSKLYGISMIDQVTLEHNLLLASKVYSNICFEELGALLEIDAEKAERVAGQMIMENRLIGYVDSNKKICHFESKSDLIHVMKMKNKISLNIFSFFSARELWCECECCGTQSNYKCEKCDFVYCSVDCHEKDWWHQQCSQIP